MKKCLHPCLCLGLHQADTNLSLQQLHIFLTYTMRVFCLKFSALRCLVSISDFAHVLQTLPSVWCDYLCTHVSVSFGWEVDFSGLWLLYFCINAVLKTYLLDLYSYRKYFILICLKGKKNHRALWTVWSCCTRFDSSRPVLFNSTWRGSLCLFFCCLIWSTARN